MTELIRIEEKDGIQVVSAKELYEFLGLDKSHYARWCKKCFTDNDFAVENIDYTLSPIMANGSMTTDFIITIDLAKKIGMMTKSKKGEEIRDYFIECEKKLKNLTPVIKEFNLPQTKLEALKMLVEAEEIIEKQNEQLLLAQPKVDFFDTAATAKNCVDFKEAIAILKNPNGMGRNKFMEDLRNRGYLMKDNLPYKNFLDLDIFKVVEISVNKGSYSEIGTKTLITQKGLVYFQKLYNNI